MPDNPTTSLVKTAQSPTLARVSNQLALTDKLLTKPEEPFLIPYRKGDKWGFCDRNKNIVIDCEWDEIGPFSEGIALAHSFSWRNHYSSKDFSKFLYININGTVIYEICLTGVWYCIGCDFSEGFGLIIIHHHNGEPPTSIVVDKNGNELFEYCTDYYSVVSTFKEGLAIINKYVFDSDDLHNTPSELFGFINTSGEVVIPCIYNDADPFSGGMATVKKDGKCFFINKQNFAVASNS